MVVILVNTEAPQVIVHRRIGEAWSAATMEGLDAILDLPEIDTRLALSDIFEGLTFDQG